MKHLTLLLLAIFSFNYLSGELCYSGQTKESEKGFLGVVNGYKLFYEIWYSRGAVGTGTYSVILRTDTFDLSNSIDFCIEEDTESDSIRVSIYEPDTEAIEFKTTNAKDIPTVFQILIPRQFGYYNFSGFNKPNSLKKFYLEDRKLFLTYTQHNRYDDHYFVISEIYELQNGQFIRTKSKSEQVRE